MTLKEIIDGAWQGAADLGHTSDALKVVMERAITAAAAEGSRQVNYGVAIPGVPVDDQELQWMRTLLGLFDQGDVLRVEVDPPHPHRKGRIVVVRVPDAAASERVAALIRSLVPTLRRLIEQIDYISGPIRDATMEGGLEQYDRGHQAASQLAKHLWAIRTRTLLNNLAGDIENRGMRLVDEGMGAIDLPEALAAIVREVKL